MKLETLILMSVVALASTSIVRAETFDQIGTFAPVTYGLPLFPGDPIPTNALSQNDLGAILPNLPNFGTAYDNFTFTSSGVISSFSWIGSYQLNTPGSIPVGGPDFRVNFYSSPLPALVGNAPIPTSASFLLTPANTNQTALGGAATGFFQYTATGTTPFNVVGGTTYFTSVIAQMDFATNGWGLSFSNIGTLASVQDFGDTALTRFNDPINYAISITAVPEPGSVGAILAVVGLIAVRRRRVAKKLFLIGE